MFSQIYEILSQFLFNGDPSTATYGELICQGISGIACALLVSLPFLICWRIIKRFL